MCDPISIGLTLAGTAMSSYAQSQVASASKRDINASGQKFGTYLADTGANYEGERGRQNAAFDTNQGTVGDTLANYSAGNQQKLQDDATAKRQASYVAPLGNKDFAAPISADSAPNSAVASRNQATADTTKARSIGEALAKAKLDAYGDAKTVSGARAADNASNIAINTQAATHSQQAADQKQAALNGGNEAQQNVLQYKLNADKHQGDTIGTIGDLFTTAGMLGAGGGGGFGSKVFGGPGSGVGGGMFGFGAPKGQASAAAFNWT